MSAGRRRWRRLAAALAGTAFLVLGAPLHVHGAPGAGTDAALAAHDARDATASHAPASCPACRTSSRPTVGLPSTVVAILPAAAPVLRLGRPGVPRPPSAAARPAAPPRAPPAPTA